MIAKTNHHHHQQPYEYEKRIDAGSRIITNRIRYLQSRYEAHGWNKRAVLEHVFTRAAFVQSLSELLVWHVPDIGQNEARRAALRLAISTDRAS